VENTKKFAITLTIAIVFIAVTIISVQASTEKYPITLAQVNSNKEPKPVRICFKPIEVGSDHWIGIVTASSRPEVLPVGTLTYHNIRKTKPISNIVNEPKTPQASLTPDQVIPFKSNVKPSEIERRKITALCNITVLSSVTTPCNVNLDLRKIMSALDIRESDEWPKGYIGFEFQVIGESGNYFIIEVVRVHGLLKVKIGDIYYLAKPQKLIKCILTQNPPAKTLVYVRKLGEITVNGYSYNVIEVRPLQETGIFPISGTVSPGYVNTHGYHYLLTRQRVDITCNWQPVSQPIHLGLIYWTYGHFTTMSAMMIMQKCLCIHLMKDGIA